MILAIEWLALFTGFTGALWIIGTAGEQVYPKVKAMLQRNKQDHSGT
jgi:hypothetical protein